MVLHGRSVAENARVRPIALRSSEHEGKVAEHLLGLQRAAGNRAVNRLLGLSGHTLAIQRMVAVNGEPTDYAIMKQVQQLKKIHDGAVVRLTDSTRFNEINPTERLYIVSHGDREDGRLRGIATADLIQWLTRPTYGLPSGFSGGITILSCYGGLTEGLRTTPETSLAKEVARGIASRVEKGTQVEGAKGYSFGTPEFSANGRSSILSLALEPFYWANDIDDMKKVWLAHKPSHTGGVLKTKFQIRNIDTAKTINSHLLRKLGKSQSKAANEIDTLVGEVVSSFSRKAKQIEKTLQETLARVPGVSIQAKTRHLIENPGDSDVKKWNETIDQQYELFESHYLWSEGRQAFQRVRTP